MQTTAPGTATEIPLSNPSFVQRAGEALLLIADARTRESRESPCTVFVNVEDSTGEAKLTVESWADKGDAGTSTEHELLPAKAVNTARTLRAFAIEDENTCDIDGEDTWTVSVNVSIVSLRN